MAANNIDVRGMGKTVLALLLCLFVFDILRILLFGEATMYISLATFFYVWFIWGLLALGIGIGVHVFVALPLLKVLCGIFRVSYTRGDTGKSLLFWVVIFLCGIVLYIMFPDYATWVQEFALVAYLTEITPPIMFGEFQRAKVFPVDDLGVYVFLVYGALIVMLVARVILTILANCEKLSGVIGGLKAPAAIMLIAISLAIVDFEWFNLHRMWAAIFVVMIIGMWKISADLRKLMPKASGEDDPQEATMASEKKNKNALHIVDGRTVLVVYFITVASLVAVFIGMVVFAIVNRGALFGI